MEKNLKKVMVILFCIFIKVSVYATGSIAIDGHVLSVDFQQEDYIIEGVIVKNVEGVSILYQSTGCDSNFCSYAIGPELPSWLEVWVRTDHGIFKFYNVENQ